MRVSCEVRTSSTYCHIYRVCVCGSVTNNNTWIRIGYRIYSLWKFQLQQITIIMNTIALIASWDPTDGTALRRRVTNYFRCRRVTNSLLSVAFPL
jgi:hypothetical protein